MNDSNGHVFRLQCKTCRKSMHARHTSSAHTRERTHVRTRTHKHAHIATHTHTDVHARTHTRTHAHELWRAHTHTRRAARISALIDVQTKSTVQYSIIQHFTESILRRTTMRTVRTGASIFYNDNVRPYLLDTRLQFGTRDRKLDPRKINLLVILRSEMIDPRWCVETR